MKRSMRELVDCRVRRARWRRMALFSWVVALAMASLAFPAVRSEPLAVAHGGNRIDDLPKNTGSGKDASFVRLGTVGNLAECRATVALSIDKGQQRVFCWLHGATGSYGVLTIDAPSGKSAFIPNPVPSGGDTPYSFLLVGGTAYSAFGGWLLGFDILRQQFTTRIRVPGRSGMSMRADASGALWIGMYPTGELIKVDPAKRAVAAFKEPDPPAWPQYPRSIAHDAKGWIYLGVGFAEPYVAAFKPTTGEARKLELSRPVSRNSRPIVKERSDGQPYVEYEGKYLALDAGAISGETSKPLAANLVQASPMQGMVIDSLADGFRLVKLDMVQKTLTIAEGEKTRDFRFDYPAAGGKISQLYSEGSDRVVGSTLLPHAIFSLDASRPDEVKIWPFAEQINAMLDAGNRTVAAIYPEGKLAIAEGISGPYVSICGPSHLVYRPLALTYAPAQHAVLLAGEPSYGSSHSGILYCDLDTGRFFEIENKGALQGQAVSSMLVTKGGRVFGGTTNAVSTGGRISSAAPAQLFEVDPRTGSIIWSGPVDRRGTDIRSLVLLDDGTVAGILDSRKLFRFSFTHHKIETMVDLPAEFGAIASGQSSRAIFVVSKGGGRSDDALLGVLQVKGISLFDASGLTRKAAYPAPRPITSMGVYVAGSVFFGSDGDLYQWKPPAHFVSMH